VLVKNCYVEHFSSQLKPLDVWV